MTKNERNLIAVTFDQHPLTGGIVVISKTITEETTVGELIAWYFNKFPTADNVYDLVIKEVESGN